MRDPRTRSGRTAATLRRGIGAELRRLRQDAGLSLRDVARAAHITPSHLSAVEIGHSEASLAVLVAIANVLGADVSVRLFPGAGPRIHDRLQAPIVEALLRLVEPSWKRLVEVPVRGPARGVIDTVFARPGRVVVATEVQSEIHRLEQQIRWGREKAEALPSADVWSMLSGGSSETVVSRLLVLRNTATNREVARAFDATLRHAFPARASDAVRALSRADTGWPGPAVIWADATGGVARILERPPRGVSLGR